MHKFRSISGWGSGSVGPLPVERSQFERITAKLGLLTFGQQKDSPELKEWAKKYRHNRFVPEDLLLHWKLTVKLEQRGHDQFSEDK